MANPLRPCASRSTASCMVMPRQKTVYSRFSSDMRPVVDSSAAYSPSECPAKWQPAASTTPRASMSLKAASSMMVSAGCANCVEKSKPFGEECV